MIYASSFEVYPENSKATFVTVHSLRAFNRALKLEDRAKRTPREDHLVEKAIWFFSPENTSTLKAIVVDFNRDIWVTLLRSNPLQVNPIGLQVIELTKFDEQTTELSNQLGVMRRTKRPLA